MSTVQEGAYEEGRAQGIAEERERCAKIVREGGTGVHRDCTRLSKDCLAQIAADILNPTI